MAKKKSKQTQKQSQQLSPEKYIRLKARSLPIVKCLITKGWEDHGLLHVVVARQHAGGTYTLGIYFVDTYCIGVKESFFMFNISPYDYETIINDMKSNGNIEASYEEAHNIIYGAVAYAEELGIKPDKSFNLMQYMLEEDTDDIPLIEYEFGKDGHPCLSVESRQEANKYIPILDALGIDYEVDVSEDKKEVEDRLFSHFNEYQDIPYSYQAPEYPEELNLTHPELNVKFKSDSDFLMPDEEIERILSLPRESLIADLQQIVLYLIGQNNGDLTLVKALFFLGELMAEEALDTVLEILRQNKTFVKANLGDSYIEVSGQTLYYVGRNRLPDLLAFMKEPGLDTFHKMVVLFAINHVSDESGRREEVLDWYRDLMNFYIAYATDQSLYSPILGGLTIAGMLDIHPVELLPDIKKFVETCEIDKICCGNYEDIEQAAKDINKPISERKLMDIYERFQTYYRDWCE